MDGQTVLLIRHDLRIHNVRFRSGFRFGFLLALAYDSITVGLAAIDRLTDLTFRHNIGRHLRFGDPANFRKLLLPQTSALRLLFLGTLALCRSTLPHLGTILGDLMLPRCGLLGGPHPQSEHSSKQRCGNQSKQRTEMQHKRTHQHDDCDHQHRDNNNPPSADRGTTKGTDMRDPFVGQLALMRLVGLHYCPFRLCGGLIGESRSTVGIHQMQRRRKAVLSVLDYPLHAFDRPFGQPESHENNHNRKHHNRA